MDLHTAKSFAHMPAEFIFEFKLPKGSFPKICNNEGVGGFGNTEEHEILTSAVLEKI